MSTATQVAEATNHVRNNAQHDIHADNAFAFAADVLVAEGKRDQEIAESYVANSQAALAGIPNGCTSAPRCCVSVVCLNACARRLNAPWCSAFRAHQSMWCRVMIR